MVLQVQADGCKSVTWGLCGLADAALHDDALPAGPRAVELHAGPPSRQPLQPWRQLEQRLQQPVWRLQASPANSTTTP